MTQKVITQKERDRRGQLQANMSKLDSITIKNLEDNLDKIEFNHVSRCFHCGHVQTQDVVIYRPNSNSLNLEETNKHWTVIFSGALDFEGNKKDMLKRYPEFKGITVDL